MGDIFTVYCLFMALEELTMSTVFVVHSCYFNSRIVGMVGKSA